MLHKLREKIKKLLKNKEIKQDKHEEMLLRMKEKLETLDGENDEDAQEEIFIIQKTIQKLEIKINDKR